MNDAMATRYGLTDQAPAAERPVNSDPESDAQASSSATSATQPQNLIVETT